MTDTPLLRRYTFYLSPRPMQLAALEAQSRLRAQLWNATLQRMEDVWRREHRSLRYLGMSAEITALRAECPEFAAAPRVSLECTVKSVDIAMQSFLTRLSRNRAAGSADRAGYPRYRRIDLGAPILLEKPKSGWDFAQSLGTPNRHRRWGLRVQSIPGRLVAKGKFPCDPLAVKAASIAKVDGRWQISVAAAMPSWRASGTDKRQGRCDLIDEFARVTGQNGEPVSGLSPDFGQGKGRITQKFEGVNAVSPEVPPQMQGDQGIAAAVEVSGSPEVPPQMQGDQGSAMRAAGGPEVPPQMQGDQGLLNCDCPECLAFDYPRAPGTRRSRSTGYADLDALKSERDRRFKRGSRAWKAMSRRVAKAQAHRARAKREKLHEWTTAIVKGSSDLTVIAPPIRQITKSAKGTKADHGAAVATVAKVNRHVLAQAPAAAIAMLTYKAAEAGIRLDLVSDPSPKAAIGQDIAKAAKAVKRVRRALKRVA